MTVKELKEELNKFNDNLIVCTEIRNRFSVISHVAQGINEMDGFLMLDDYSEEDD